MANSGIAINAAYNDGYGESVGRQGPRFTVGDDLFDYIKGYIFFTVLAKFLIDSKKYKTN